MSVGERVGGKEGGKKRTEERKEDDAMYTNDAGLTHLLSLLCE